MWRFASAVATGTSHVRGSLPCQDRVACRAPRDNAIIIVVSDGAGSAPKGEVGAEIATTVFCESIEAQLNAGDSFHIEQAMHAAIADVIAAVRRRGKEDGFPSRDYAATLLAFVQDGDTAAAAQIGDGVICLSDAADSWSWFEWPQRGEYASSTYFLTDEGAAERFRVERLSPAPSAVIAMTDGLEPLALNYATRTVHHEFAVPLIKRLRESTATGEDHALSASLATFLSLDRITSRVDDDLSIVLAYRQSD
ncbi:MAG: PP2C family serine/threonine-protein phosphatase [Hyphomonadaceae bacterium]